MLELRNKCDTVEKTEAEKLQLSEKKHQEELQALRKTNQQLKVQSDTPKDEGMFLCYCRLSWKVSLPLRRSYDMPAHTGIMNSTKVQNPRRNS